MPDLADTLIAELDEAPCWPLPREKKAREQVALGRALRTNDTTWLREYAQWDTDRKYVSDALAKRMADGFADFLFSEDLTIKAAGDNKQAQDELDHQIEANRMPAKLHRAERICASEGEVWWKLHTNQALADVPIVTWSSRDNVVPLFYGERVIAAAFVTDSCTKLEKYSAADEDLCEVVYRHAEVHCDKRVVNVLYRGRIDELGRRVALDTVTQTAGIAEEQIHGLAMWAGRVVNTLDDDDTLGVSAFHAVEDMLLALNEAVTISTENMRLTGKDRVFVAGRFTQADGSFDASLEVFQVESDQSVLGEGSGKPPIYGIEKSYDAAPAWMHITNLARAATSRTGLVPQWIGEELGGSAESGVTVRLRFLPTTNTAKGMMREWGYELPHILDLGLKIAGLAEAQGGFGRKVDTDEPPSVEFGDPLPTDTGETLDQVGKAVTAQVMSRRTAVETIHPTWDTDQVDAELKEITDDDPTLGEREDPPPPPTGPPVDPPPPAE